MSWISWSKNNSTDLATLLDRFEDVRPSKAIEGFVSTLVRAFNHNVSPENAVMGEGAFAEFQTAKSLEKLLLTYEWEKGRGQSGLDRHIQIVEAQLLPLYEKIVNSSSARVLNVDVDENAENGLSNAIVDVQLAHGVDMISNAEELLKKTKQAISKLVGNEQSRGKR